MPHDAKDPFAARTRAVDAALRSKSAPVVQAQVAIEAAEKVAAAESGATVDSVVSPAAVWNGTPGARALPPGLAAVVGRGRRRWTGRVELTEADAVALAVSWDRARARGELSAGWRAIAFAVVRRACGNGGRSSARRAAELAAEGAAARAWRHWPAVVAAAKAPTDPRRVSRWIAARVGPRRVTRRAVQLLARAILRHVTIGRATGTGRTAASLDASAQVDTRATTTTPAPARGERRAEQVDSAAS